MAAKTEFVPDKWQAFGHVPLSAADAVECGYTRAAADAALAAAFPGESGLTLAQAKKELGNVRPSSPPESGSRPRFSRRSSTIAPSARRSRASTRRSVWRRPTSRSC